MEVFNRFFLINNDEVLKAHNEYKTAIKKYKDELVKIRDEVGAESIYYFEYSFRFAGFSFKEKPNKELWKKVRTGLNIDAYSPRLSTKFGREFIKRVDPITPKPNNAFVEIGLCTNTYVYGEDAAYRAIIDNLHTAHGDYVLLKAPWTNDPECNDKHDWVPPIGIDEIKSWEAEKLIYEHNAIVRGEA